MFIYIHTGLIKITFVLLLSFVIAGCQTTRLDEVRNTFKLKRDTPAPVVRAPLRETRQSIPASGSVVVQKGDNLYSIATRFQVTPQSIIMDNQLLVPYELYAGQVLQVKSTKVHIVTNTDSIFSLSQRYAVSQYELARLNQLSEPFELSVGQVLLLPETLDLSVLQIDGLNPEKVKTTVLGAPSTAPVLEAKKPLVKTFVAPSLGQTGFTWPLEGKITTEFGPAERGVHNDGVKVSAPLGALVTTSAPGTVAFVGRELKRFGTLVLIKHKGGFITAYAHLDELSVKEGDVLGDGTVIGQVGTTGYVDSPQLHFEIRKSRKPVNPRELIS